MIGFSYLKNATLTSLLGSTPSLSGLDLTGITDGNVPYVSASGFADTEISYDGSGLYKITSTSSAKPQLELVNDNDDDNEPRFRMIKQSDTPADNDPLGAWQWRGNDSASNELGYVFIDCYSSDVTNGDVAGEFKLRVRRDNTADVVLDINGYNGSVGEGFIEFNQGEGDWDFIVNASGVADVFVVQGSDGFVGIGEVAPVTQLEMTGSTPYITLHNSTTEDTDGGRESRIIARGEQSGGEETILGLLEFAHDGTSDDQKGLFRVLLNDGDDGTTPSLTALTCGSTGEVQFHQTAHFDAEVDNGNSGATDTIDWTAGNKQKSTLTDNCTFTFSPEPSGPCSLTLKLVQDGTGSRTVTWPADVYWPGGTAPTLSTGAADVDIITFYYDGTDFYGQSALDFS